MDSLADKDHRYLWHPFTQMRDWLQEEPVIISSGSGVRLRDTQGREYLDANSSIWTNIHGHQHPRINAAIRAQLDRIAHSSFLGFTNQPAIELAEKLVALAPKGLSRVFYSDDGSTAIEVAIKMAVHYWQHCGEPQRRRFLAFADAYHGDTIGAVSLGGIDLFHATYKPLLFEVEHVLDLASLKEMLGRSGSEIAAVAIEPLIQGAAGLKVWPRGLLAELRQLCDQHGTLLMADEVMTGFGRTGTMFACEQESVTPDFLCVAKGLTGGYLPMAATLTRERIFEAFLGDYAERKTFFHGHSYTGNALGCAAALGSLEVFEQERTLEALPAKIGLLRQELESFRPLKSVMDVRQCGFIAGIEVGPFPWEAKAGIRVCQQAREWGVLTRPVGNVIVIMPPLCISPEDLSRICDVLRRSISKVLA